MSEKPVKAVLKMLIKAGSANPAPPVGSTLGPYGLNLMQFCKDFNDQTSSATGMIPVVVTVYEDRTYTFVIKTSPVAELVKQALGVPSGAGNPIKDTVGTLTLEQVTEIAEKKMSDLNSYNLEGAVNQVLGTCKSMGVKWEAKPNN